MTAALPNLRHLQVFLEVVRRGSTSAAARAVHLSQPAVSQAVAAIELAMKAPLFRRTATGMAPTAAGRALAERVARALYKLLEGGVESARGRTRNPALDALQLLRGITVTQLSALMAVAEQGGFGAAACALGVARPTLHRAARQLECALGTALFEQTSFGLRLTRYAERLARRAGVAFSELEQARAEIAAAAGEGSGRTVIGAMPLARSLLVPSAVLEFASAHPQHAISILDGPYDSMLAALRCGAADILVGAIRDPAPYRDVVQEHLFDDPLALIVRAQHPLAQRFAPSVRELAGYAWIAPRPGAPLRRHFETLVSSIAEIAQAPAAAPIECNSLVAARAMLLASNRVMLLSAHQIHRELAAGQLVALAHPLGRVVRPIALTRRRDWRPTAAQEVLLEALRRQARAFAVDAPSRALNCRGDTRMRRVKKRLK